MAKLFKRGRIWHAWVRKRGGGVKRVSTLCTDKRAAEAALAQLEREAVDPAYAAANRTTVQRVVDDYFRSREVAGRSDGTLHHVRVKSGHLVRLLPGRAADVTHAAAFRYVGQRSAEGARRTTVKKELRVLSAALGLARRNGLYLEDPARVIPALDDDYEPRRRALTPWELVGLCATLPLPRARQVAFIVATGARWGESTRALSQDVAGSMVYLRGTKTEAAARTVPVPPSFRGILAWSLTGGRREAAGLARVGPLFERWTNVRRDVGLACAELGIAPVTPNDLRRTFATWLRAGGISPQLIGVAMGHTTSRMVERVYGRLTPEALGRLLEEGEAVRLVCGAADGSAQVAASGATEDDAVSAGDCANLGAQGRNRTADTGIFSPLAERRFREQVRHDRSVGLSRRAIGVLCSDRAAPFVDGLLRAAAS